MSLSSESWVPGNVPTITSNSKGKEVWDSDDNWKEPEAHFCIFVFVLCIFPMAFQHLHLLYHIQLPQVNTTRIALQNPLRVWEQTTLDAAVGGRHAHLGGLGSAHWQRSKVTKKKGLSYMVTSIWKHPGSMWALLREQEWGSAVADSSYSVSPQFSVFVFLFFLFQWAQFCSFTI